MCMAGVPFLPTWNYPSIVNQLLQYKIKSYKIYKVYRSKHITLFSCLFFHFPTQGICLYYSPSTRKLFLAVCIGWFLLSYSGDPTTNATHSERCPLPSVLKQPLSLLQVTKYLWFWNIQVTNAPSCCLHMLIWGGKEKFNHRHMDSSQSAPLLICAHITHLQYC